MVLKRRELVRQRETTDVAPVAERCGSRQRNTRLCIAGQSQTNSILRDNKCAIQTIMKPFLYTAKL